MLQDSCLQCLTKREVATVATANRELQPALGHWLFLQHVQPHGNLRLYCDMLRELRRMGLFPLYLQLHSPYQAGMMQLAFTQFKDRQSQFATTSISRFFRFTTPPAVTSHTLDGSWQQSRLYLMRLQASMQQQHLYSYLALCEHNPEHAARRYPLGTGGLRVMEHVVAEALWPRNLLQLLLSELTVPLPLMWFPLLTLAARRWTQRWRQRQLTRGFRAWVRMERSRLAADPP